MVYNSPSIFEENVELEISDVAQYARYTMEIERTYTSNLLSGGAATKDVQELLGHSDVSTTMNVYAHSKREDKRTSARLLDKIASGV